MRVLIADDHPLVLRGLRDALEKEGFEVAAEATDGQQAVQLAQQTRPDAAVLDLGMPGLNGIDAAREMQRRCPGITAVLCTIYEEEQFVLEAMRAGIRGYVLKSQAPDGVVDALREAGRGGVYFSPGLAGNVVEACRSGASAPRDPLSPRERQVLQLVAEGKTTKEVAAVLGVSVKTADSHRTRLMRKLDIHETAGLVRYAIRRGLVRA